MMLVVIAVTSATLYLAGNNLRAKQQEKLEAQFQNEVRSYLALQETRLRGINEKCRLFSHRSEFVPLWKSVTLMIFIGTR
jgi:hypothetical protein